MRKFLISAAIVTAVAATAPATAQRGEYYPRHGYAHNDYGRDIPQQLGQLADRIERARDRRLISSGEARSLRKQLERIDDRYDDYRRGGLTRWEHQELQQRIQDLRQRVRYERQEGREDRRYDRRY